MALGRYIPYRKKKSWQEMTNFFASDKSIYRLSFSDNYFYRRLILIDEYSYRHFFLQKRTFSIL